MLLKEVLPSIAGTVVYKELGIIFLYTHPVRKICNSILLREEWSVAPGHCVAARSDPDLAYLLPFWKIKYSHNGYQYLG